jgi:hypothetical protein
MSQPADISAAQGRMETILISFEHVVELVGDNGLYGYSIPFTNIQEFDN